MTENVTPSPEANELYKLHSLLSELFADHLDRKALEYKQSTPRFTDLSHALKTDERGVKFLRFTDDQNWEVNIPLHLVKQGDIEISPRDHVFQLMDSIFAFIHYSNGDESPQIFLLNHFHPDNAPLMDDLWYERGKIMALLREGRTEMQLELLKGVEAMPYFGSFPSNVVTVIPWTPSSITESLSGESMAEYQARSANLLNPVELQQVYHQMPIELQETLVGPQATLFGLTFFSTFYAHVDSPNKNRLATLHEAYKSQKLGPAFLNAFGACEVSWEVGESIIQSLEKPYGHKVLEKDEELFFLQQQLLSRHPEEVARILSLQSQHQNWGEVLDTMHAKLDKNVFKTVIARKRAELWKVAAKTEPNWSNFAPLTVFWGALFKAITKNLDLPESSEMIDLLLQDSEIQVITGSSDLLIDPNDILNPENYLRPDEFGLEDYLALRGSGVEKTYRKIDSKACDELIERIPFDSMDPMITRILIRKNVKLVAHAKIKPHVKNGILVPNEFEFGNFYVFDSTLQGSYGLGQALKHFAFAMAPENATVVGQTSLLNPTLQGNIDLGWEVGRNIVRIGDSLPFVETAHHFSHAAYISKGMERNYIKGQAVDSDFELEGDLEQEIYFFKIDTSKGNTESFGHFLSTFFEKGYVLTRIFYQPDEKGRPNLREAYIVLEKELSAKI